MPNFTQRKKGSISNDCVKIDTTTQKLVYTSLGGSNEAKYNLRSNVNSVLIPDYGYEEQYFFYTQQKEIVLIKIVNVIIKSGQALFL